MSNLSVHNRQQWNQTSVIIIIVGTGTL